MYLTFTKTRFTAPALVLLAFITPLAVADSGFYIGVQRAQIQQPFPARVNPLNPRPMAFDFSATPTGQYEADNPTFPASDDAGVWLLKGGWNFTKRFAVEARYTLTDDSFQPPAWRYDVTRAEARLQRTRAATLDQIYGLYGRLNFRGDGRFRPYIIAGYASVETTEVYTYTPYSSGSLIRTDTRIDNLTEQDFSYGLGFKVGLNRRLDFNVEWMNYSESEDLKGLNAGLAFKF